MNLNSFKKKSIMIPAVVVAVVAVGGGSALAIGAGQDDHNTSEKQVAGATRDKVAAAAIALVGEGATVTDVETEDHGTAAYEVELVTKAGAEAEIKLDKDLQVVTATDQEDARDQGDQSRTVGSITVDDEDKAIADTEVPTIAAAATAVAPGTVLEIESETPDRGETGPAAATTYEVKIQGANGVAYTVDLDSNWAVVAR